MKVIARNVLNMTVVTLSEKKRREHMKEERTLYFAYGSNCNTRQMAHRCPKATDLGKVTAHGYALEFRTHASIRKEQGAQTEGVLWSITDDCEKSLDGYEGFPTLYRKEWIVVEHNGVTSEAMVYIMNPQRRTISPPHDDYRDGILEGLAEHEASTGHVLTAIKESQRHAGKTQVTKIQRKGRRLKLEEERTTIRTYVDNSLLEAVDDYVHQRKKKEKGYSRSDCINEALAELLAKKKEEENHE